ncbi:uncharacterized protein BO87DRAFT_387007 [Aspergillus neoniger CBS 115656]|uniref:Uncharacterized protein n=1 Tax=Aspergillus neoniger (strain CBS 115656) TaxID=1448310 RepID=A0A318YHQ9_ASPNB|nr:hypothetical protein BO87DRAFT_387007 [Aspergillus neoniger CBS 115656]PYH34041.1 hypothetical protein BO87DRAFT_387007 [Aspergillus neoniger CBS 115656]
MPMPSVGAGFTQQEAVFQHPASGNQPPDRLLAADDNDIAQGSASQLYECLRGNGCALPNSRVTEALEMARNITRTVWNPYHAEAHNLYGVLRHSSRYPMRTGTMEGHRVEAGIDDPAATGAPGGPGDSDPNARRRLLADGKLTRAIPVSCWMAVNGKWQTITEKEPRGYVATLRAPDFHSKCGLHFTPHEQAIQRHIGVCLTATLDYRVRGYAAYSQGGSLQNTTTIQQHKAVRVPATSNYIALIGFPNFEHLHQRPQSTYDVVGQGISDKAISKEMKPHHDLRANPSVSSNGTSLFLNTPSGYKQRYASATVDVGTRTRLSHRTWQEQS